GVVVHASLWTGLGVATRPDADIDGIDRLRACQGMVGRQVLQTVDTDLADRQGVVETAPLALMQRLYTQEGQGGDGAGREQRVTQFKERIAATPKGSIGRRTKGREYGKVSGVHTLHSLTPSPLASDHTGPDQRTVP